MYRSNPSRYFWIGLFVGTGITFLFMSGMLTFNAKPTANQPQINRK